MGEVEWLPLGPSNELFSARRPPTGDPTDGVRRAPYSIRTPPVKALLAAARHPPAGQRAEAKVPALAAGCFGRIWCCRLTRGCRLTQATGLGRGCALGHLPAEEH